MDRLNSPIKGIAPRSKDPLTAATLAILVPALKEAGFRRRSNRLIGRLSEIVFQLIYLQRSAYGGGDFCVNYASMTLIPPEDNLVLTNGDRLRSASGSDIWWPSATHEQADDAMHAVVKALRVQALPFFEATQSTEGMIRHLKKAVRSPDHHGEFALGALLAWTGDSRSAINHLENAVALYIADGREWCEHYRDLAVQLLAAIRASEQRGLLLSWRAESVAALGLTSW